MRMIGRKEITGAVSRRFTTCMNQPWLKTSAVAPKAPPTLRR